MLDDYPRSRAGEAFDRLVRGIDMPVDRAPQQKGGFELPVGTRVVSADSHWSITDDLFYRKVPDHLKDRAPRLYTDQGGVHHWEVNGSSIIPPGFALAAAAFDRLPGSWQIEPRLADMDVEGVEMEIVFGNLIGAFYNEPDLELREWIYRIYNEHLADVHARSGGRFHGVGLINFWDMARVADSIAEIESFGLKTFLLPMFAKGAGGEPLTYAAPEMDPLWSAIEAAGLPVCFHVGEFYHAGPGALGTSGMMNFGPFRKNLGELIFGGILDRHPALQIVFAEAELNWVPGALQTASMMYECYNKLLDPQIRHHPRHYWHRNCYATFTNDPVGLQLLEVIGADRVMWSVDYPHQESTFGFSWSAMQSVVDAVHPDQAREILGGTAMRVFGLE